MDRHQGGPSEMALIGHGRQRSGGVTVEVTMADEREAEADTDAALTSVAAHW